MANFEKEFKMLMVLGECKENYRDAAEMYNLRYPDLPRPSHMAFLRLKRRLIRSGSVQQKRNKSKTKTNEDNATNILAFVRVNPHSSTRQISRESNVSKSSILRIFRNYKFHPYHISLHQCLYEDDFVNRLNFCTWMRQVIDRDPLFTYSIMFSDEASFSNTGQVNRHNMHYWSDVNPNWMRTVPYQRRWTLNVWCGIIADYVIGPFFIEARLTGPIYANFLRQILPQLLEEVPLNIRLNMWMQHDGAPPHNALLARHTMNEMFHEKWIGRGGPVNWPARSPDLTSMDFFLWGFIKERVMSTAPTTPEDMQIRIRQACAEVTPQMLDRVRKNFQKRILKCIEVEGHHFEHLKF